MAFPAGLWRTIPLGREAESRYGAPYYVAERRLLHRLLLEAAWLMLRM